MISFSDLLLRDLRILTRGLDPGEGLLHPDLLLGEVLLDLRIVELADDVSLLDPGALGDKKDDLVLAADLADAVDCLAALQAAPLDDRDPQAGPLDLGDERPIGARGDRPGRDHGEVADTTDEAHPSDQAKEPAAQASCFGAVELRWREQSLHQPVEGWKRREPMETR